METIMYVGLKRPLGDAEFRSLELLLGQKVDTSIDVAIRLEARQIPGSSLTQWLVIEGRTHGYFRMPHSFVASGFRVWYLAAEFFEARFGAELWYTDEYEQEWIRFDKATRDAMLHTCPLAHHVGCHANLAVHDGPVEVILLSRTSITGVPIAFDRSGMTLAIGHTRRCIEYSEIRELNLRRA